MIYPAKLNKEAWENYTQYRKEQKMRKLKDMSIKRMTGWLSNYEMATQADIVDTTIRNGWIGLFPPKDVKPKLPTTNDEWLKLGATKGLKPKAGESWPDFKERVRYTNVPF